MLLRITAAIFIGSVFAQSGHDDVVVSCSAKGRYPCTSSIKMYVDPHLVGHGDALLGTSEVKSATECQQKCYALSQCKSYSFYRPSSEGMARCRLFNTPYGDFKVQSNVIQAHNACPGCLFGQKSSASSVYEYIAVARVENYPPFEYVDATSAGRCALICQKNQSCTGFEYIPATIQLPKCFAWEDCRNSKKSCSLFNSRFILDEHWGYAGHALFSGHSWIANVKRSMDQDIRFEEYKSCAGHLNACVRRTLDSNKCGSFATKCAQLWMSYVNND
jgi:hypothetical protein